MSAAREAILSRLSREPGAPLPQRSPLPAPEAKTPSEHLSRLGTELAKLSARFVRAGSPDEAQAAVAAVLEEFGVKTAALWDNPLLAALGLPELMSARGVELLRPGGEACGPAARADLGLTAADGAVAESGTIIVRAAPSQPRAFSLLPPVHLALVRADQVSPRLADVPDILARLAREAGGPPSAVHFISGPSCTADIELVKVLGVHGPTTLIVLGLDFTP